MDAIVLAVVGGLATPVMASAVSATAGRACSREGRLWPVRSLTAWGLVAAILAANAITGLMDWKPAALGWPWLLYVPVAGALAATLDPVGQVAPWRWLIRLLLLAGLWPLAPATSVLDERLFHLLVMGAGSVAIWTAFDRVEFLEQPRSLLVWGWVGCFAAAAGLAVLAGSLRLGQFGGVVAAAVAGIALIATITRYPGFLAGLLPTAGLIFPAFLYNTRFQTDFGDVPAWPYVLLFLTPLALTFGHAPRVEGQSPWRPQLFGFIAAFTIAVIALAPAIRLALQAEPSE